MKFYLYTLIALFAVALVLGCTGLGGGAQNQTTTGPVTVTPTQLVGGGTATVQYTLTNNYENEMSNVKISVLGVPSGYTVSSSGMITTSKIVANQQYPAIFTIKAPSVSIKQTLTPKIQVCYDYTTNYYFDSALKTSALAGETVTTESAASTGPISVTQLGLDNLFVTQKDEEHTGSLQITNTGGGKIIQFNSIKMNKPVGTTNVASIGLSYSDCGSSTTTELKPSSCSLLSNTLAVANGLTVTATVTTSTDPAKLTAVATERTEGSVSTNYCTDIPIGTITVCPAGKAC